MSYNRNLQQLEANAVRWWPESLKKKNADANVIPRLLQTQEEFLRLLCLSKKGPFELFDLIRSENYPANLFLKHLVVLANYGGEPITRLGNSFADIFEQDCKGFFFHFHWCENKYTYHFESLPIKGLSNKKLYIDGKGLTFDRDLDDLYKDMIAILLFAASSQVADKAGLDACNIGSLLGDSKAIETFVKQNYITASRITGGATANNLGQFAQSELVEFLKKKLGNSFEVVSNGKITLEGDDSPIDTPFDVVVTKGSMQIGIEVSFQVTTNSTIERKKGQAADRQKMMHAAGHSIAYVIDGAGNFQRPSAISTICDHSDCTVAFSENEFETLSDWIMKKSNEVR